MRLGVSVSYPQAVRNYLTWPKPDCFMASTFLCPIANKKVGMKIPLGSPNGVLNFILGSIESMPSDAAQRALNQAVFEVQISATPLPLAMNLFIQGVGFE